MLTENCVELCGRKKVEAAGAGAGADCARTEIDSERRERAKVVKTVMLTMAVNRSTRGGGSKIDINAHVESSRTQHHAYASHPSLSISLSTHLQTTGLIHPPRSASLHTRTRTPTHAHSATTHLSCLAPMQSRTSLRSRSGTTPSPLCHPNATQLSELPARNKDREFHHTRGTSLQRKARRRKSLQKSLQRQSPRNHTPKPSCLARRRSERQPPTSRAGMQDPALPQKTIRRPTSAKRETRTRRTRRERHV